MSNNLGNIFKGDDVRGQLQVGTVSSCCFSVVQLDGVEIEGTRQREKTKNKHKSFISSFYFLPKQQESYLVNPTNVENSTACGQQAASSHPACGQIYGESFDLQPTVIIHMAEDVPHTPCNELSLTH